MDYPCNCGVVLQDCKDNVLMLLGEAPRIAPLRRVLEHLGPTETVTTLYLIFLMSGFISQTMLVL